MINWGLFSIILFGVLVEVKSYGYCLVKEFPHYLEILVRPVLYICSSRVKNTGESCLIEETMKTYLSSQVKAKTRISFKIQRARVTDNLECKFCHTKFSLWINY